MERSRRRSHGDDSTNVAMQIAKSAGVSARTVAELLAPAVGAAAGIHKVEVAGPGFLNVTLERHVPPLLRRVPSPPRAGEDPDDRTRHDGWEVRRADARQSPRDIPAGRAPYFARPRKDVAPGRGQAVTSPGRVRASQWGAVYVGISARPGW
ncbi:hypothetical protein [Streptomyces sp. NPDC056660]|uniref:hypothetical protein n=1 Tax=Streptomyces sp. NPDC056660 TaxID=3345897 RepID=UPI0036A85DE6